MKIYHVTTRSKIKQYRATGHIIAPVRGFNNATAALAWALQTGRTIVIEFNTEKAHKLPDHHNKFGEAWWADENITDWSRVWSAGKQQATTIAGQS